MGGMHFVKKDGVQLDIVNHPDLLLASQEWGIDPRSPGEVQTEKNGHQA